MNRLIYRLLGVIAGLAATNVPAQNLYTVTDLGLYVAQDIMGPATNAAGWEVSTYTSSFPLNSYSLVKRPGDPGFSALFPSAYLYLDAAYGINDKNMIVGATNLFYSTNYAYRADGNLVEMLRLTDITDKGASGITNIEKATRILDNGTIIGLGRTSGDAIHVVQLTPIAPELHWDANGATTGLPQGSGTWSHSSGNWTTNTAGTSVAGWIDGAIARFYYNNAPSTITVTDNIVLEGLWASYSPNALTIEAGGGALTFTGQGFIRMAGSPSNVTISAPIAGSAGLSVSGQSDLFLEGNNTFTGVTQINGSDVYVRHQNALGATGTGNETVINTSSRLRLDRNLTIAETLVLNGGSIYLQPDYSMVESRAVTLAGPIVLQENYGRIGGANPDYNATLTVSGVISESGGSRNLLISGATLTGTNTFTGDLIAADDGVTVNQVTDAGVAGPLGQGTRFVLGYQSEGSTPGALRYQGASASTNREIYLEGGGAIDVQAGATTLTLSGLISGSGGSLQKTGAGTLVLTGANTFSSGTQVQEGTLRLSNTTGSALGTGSVTIDDGATLTGTGTFSGDLTLNGLYAPGNSPALITLPGSLTLGSTGFLEFEIGGLARGTQYDAIDLGGMFSSEGSIRLTLINGFMPSLGDSFNLLDWGTAGSISFLSFDTSALTGGLYWDTSLLATNGVVSITNIAPAIPEPSTYAVLAGLAALGLAAWRRRSAVRAAHFL
jgi:autotransporter-associated beta strand protein